MNEPRLTGTLDSVENHGTIVTLVLTTDAGRTHRVHMDHSPFRWLVEGAGDSLHIGATINVYETEDGDAVEVA